MLTQTKRHEQSECFIEPRCWSEILNTLRVQGLGSKKQKFPHLGACSRDVRRHPTRPRSRAIDARLSSSMLFASLSKQRYLASFETVSAFPLARATLRSGPSHQPALWPCPWRLWAFLDLRQLLWAPCSATRAWGFQNPQYASAGL